MARGYLFTVAKEIDAFPFTDADTFAMGEDSQQAEWFEDITSADMIIERFLSNCNASWEKEKTIYKAIFSEESKTIYFKNRFDRFMEMTRNISLKDFSSLGMNDILAVIEDSYDDAVIDPSECFYTLDRWMRDMEPGRVYYFGNVILMH